jgi:hypothetical protein
MSDGLFSSPLDIPPEIREAIYCHEVLRTVGVPAAFIFAMKFDDGIGLIVRWRDVEIAVAGYHTSMTNDEFERDWPAAVDLWNRTSSTDSRWAFQESETRQNAVSIIAALSLAVGDLSEMKEPS